jgi:hypothetical protein
LSESGSFVWGDAYVQLEAEAEHWVMEPIIPVGGICNLYSRPKTGKSFAAIGISIAVSSGLPEWNGFPIRLHGPVAYIQVDTPRGEWKSRLKKIVDAGQGDISKIAMMDMKMAPYPYNILVPQHLAWLTLQLKEIQPVLVIIDTLREVHEADENSSTEMKKVMGVLVAACRPAAVLLISHSRKDSQFNQMGQDSDLMDEGRGSSYVSGRMDTIIKMTGKKGKGHLIYKGRSVAEGKIPIIQDPETGLIQLATEHEKKEQVVMAILRQHPEWSRHKMGVALHAQGHFGSTKTAERWIEKLSGLLPEEFEAPAI